MLSVRGLSKHFGGTQALDGIELNAQAGEVLAVVGENGAGKSTLMKLLAGALKADAGYITLADKQYHPEDPATARQAGVAIVPQESELAPHLSVAENILLGCEPTRFGIVQRSELRTQAEQALRQVVAQEHSIDCKRQAGDLSPSERQLVTIARALAQTNLRVLIFDEPTSSLTSADVAQLFAIISRLKQRGIAVLYVSHFLEEVLTIADRYCVIRDGRIVGRGAIAETNASELVSLMAGAAVVQRSRRIVNETGPVMLEVRGLSGLRSPNEVDLELHAGEVFGIAGLVGAGRTELARAIFGLDPVKDGRLRVKSFDGPFAPARSIELGVGLLSEDRRREGLAQALSIAQNITMPKLASFGPIITMKAQNASVSQYIGPLSIRCRDLEQPVSELSGGNQQKVALARLLYQDADILLLDEPTRGIDVRSRLDVHSVIDGFVGRGKAVLLISSYLPELLVICDRIAVMCRGRLGVPKPASEWDEHSLLMEATGAE